MKLVDLELFLHYERPLAILVSLDGERKNAVWLPKEPVEWEVTRQARGGEIIQATMPESLALEKRLI